ncbi:MAG: ATPase domain-containing protein [Nanoarchaeota archaeon]
MVAQKTNRVKVYIPGLDPIIGGGFKNNSINLIVGGAGSGKTIFAVQFLYNRIVKNNDAVLYITFEEKKKELYENMLVLGWDLEKLEKKGKFIFLEYSPEQVKKMLVEGGGLIENIITKSKIKCLVIDSITSFTLLYKDELSKKEAALSLFELIRNWNCTALLTEEITDFERDEKGGLQFEVDSIILLYHGKEKGIRKRAIEILKQRGTTHTGKTMQMEVTSKGLVVNPNKIVTFKENS